MARQISNQGRVLGVLLMSIIIGLLVWASYLGFTRYKDYSKPQGERTAHLIGGIMATTIAFVLLFPLLMYVFY